MSLRLRGLRPIQHIIDQLAPVRELDLAAVDVPDTLPVRQKKVIAALATSEIDVLPAAGGPELLLGPHTRFVGREGIS